MLPLFFSEDIIQNDLVLNEENSRHVAQVLRMENGEQIQLTDGKGTLANAVITDNHKKSCLVSITHRTIEQAKNKKVTIAISLLKNAARFEWFLEKVTELGIAEIVPLLCERTEKQHFRFDRMNGILISAMLQSHQTWKPKLQSPIKFNDYIQQAIFDNKLIAHCETNPKTHLKEISAQNSNLILIGPEGDFTSKEIAFARDFIPVSLGDTRLRTETAGVAAAVFLCS